MTKEIHYKPLCICTAVFTR